MLKRIFKRENKRIGAERNVPLEKLLKKRPFVLNIETTNICNARCAFCAYVKSKRKKEEMPLALYEKIIREYSEMGGGALCFTPIIGDFFLDKQSVKRIEIARKFNNIGMISVTTNGIALDSIDESGWKFLIHNIDFLQFSIGGTDRQSYKEMYGVDRFDNVDANIMSFSRLAKQLRPDFRIRVIFRVADKLQIENEQKVKEYRDLVDEVLIDNVYGNWGGLVEKTELPEGAVFKENLPIEQKRNPCFVFYLGLTVTSSGLASICGCMNAEAVEMIVGDCKKESLKNIWQGKKYKAARKSFGSVNMPEVCKKCSQYEDGVAFSIRPEVLRFKDGRYPFGY